MELFREEIRTVGWTLWIFVGCALLYLWLLDDPYAGLLITVGVALAIGSVITVAHALAGLVVRVGGRGEEQRIPSGGNKDA